MNASRKTGAAAVIGESQDVPFQQAPLSLSWDDQDKPLPVRPLRTISRQAAAIPAAAPPWWDTGLPGEPFSFCDHVRRLCCDVAARCESLYHLDTSRLLFAVTQARSHRAHGLQARVTPLRFRNGSLTRRRHGVQYQVQRYFVNGREVLYLVTFCLPRFLDLDFDEKFITLFHELYHVSPAFDGDLRRHGGRYAIHSHSQRLYDRQMAGMAREYLAAGADPQLYSFLRLNFAQLLQRHGSVVGVVVPHPKMVPIAVG